MDNIHEEQSQEIIKKENLELCENFKFVIDDMRNSTYAIIQQTKHDLCMATGLAFLSGMLTILLNVGWDIYSTMFKLIGFIILIFMYIYTIYKAYNVLLPIKRYFNAEIDAAEHALKDVLEEMEKL